MDYLSAIKAVAPWIGTAMAGPLGGMALSAAANALGIPDASVDAVKKAISGATPEQMLALKNADQEFSLKMQELGFKNALDMDALVAGDRKDARAMQVATQSKMPAVITCMVTLGFFGVLAALLVMPEIKANEIVLVMVGQLSAVWGACVAFYVSTTFSSASKTNLLAQSVPSR